MSAMTTPAPTGAPAPRGGSRLRGEVWTVLRPHRAALLVWGAYVLAMAGWMLWLRVVALDGVRRESASCQRQGGCVDIESAMSYGTSMSMIGTLVSYLCYGVAAWAGASLTGRELERGTARLAWTQSVTPTRWLVVRLAVPAAVLIPCTTVLVLLYRSAWGADRSVMGDEWYYPDPMVNRGPLLVAYALCALAVGALAGLALKRALPALAVALGFMVWFHLMLDDLFPRLWPATTLTGADAARLPMSADQLDLGAVTASGARVDDLSCFDADTDLDYTRCTSGKGFTDLYAEVHPASHFWPLHLMATTVVLAVTVLATAAAFWFLRRRTR
ncbi:ABC transporter permease [Streptomyces griseiscabiei]|uniref:ABC transporter permease n=1 Tax=Streptomyces griseiscabiei TaxID=2993540 RepID=A0ABU4LHD6_9ACTN|nr:ABC transporter permease [Streptomyces griseiscabiei]MDX2915202.1 ABC transporter permease [Streptomyces griseiscabiei]